jgi:polyhydroxyalkanoate synthesis regulator phasin
MTVRDILDLLDGRDLEIREKDPEKVRKMLDSKGAQSDIDSIIEKQWVELKKGVLATYGFVDPLEKQIQEFKLKLKKFKS